MMTETTYTFWIKVTPTELEGQWIAHCPDFDVMSQGNGPAHAVKMLQEALAMSFAEDLVAGVDPHSRRVGTDEWDAFKALLARSVPCTLEDGTRRRATLVTSASMTVRYREHSVPDESGVLPVCDSTAMLPSYACG